MKSATKIKMEHSKQRKISDFNEIFTCSLCDGYMIDPTAVENCGHTYCRSCIFKHILKSAYCPQCGNDGKPITAEQLAQDNILRALIYKMLPNVYQAEKQRQTKYYTNKKRHSSLKFESEALSQQEAEEGFFMPAEPISLSLEYHPALLKDCQDGEVPPIRYLQCPASVQIQHLKRFLCSKFALDPQNDRIAVEIIYEDEILPDNFMLMDVGYCYNWKREAPMRFMYRVMVYDQPPPKVETKLADSNEEPKPKSQKLKASLQKSLKSVTFAEAATLLEPEPETTKVSKSLKVIETKAEEEEDKPAPVKVVISRKPATEAKKSGSKRSHAHKSHSQAAEPAAPTNDFKSLRSNDIRFSDYTVTTTTTTSSKTKTTAAATTKTNTSPRLTFKATSSSSSLPQTSVVPIVVSIPQSQVAKSPYAFDEQSDNLSLAQLKSACKKSPNVATSAKNQAEPITKNIPKLKIELNSLKAKICIPKPKSADAIYATKKEHSPSSKKSKHRKHSLDESGPIAGKVDLETYAKIIGLKPIDVAPPSSDDAEKTLKYSPNASPMSSCSSSTTSSSNSTFPAFGEFGVTSSSSHKKHKKKHSRESREPKESKRRKLHAEISSQPADESLKMKVKITSTPATHSHKTHKSKTTPPATPATTEPKISITPPKSPPKFEQPLGSSVMKTAQNDGRPSSPKSKSIAKSDSCINIVALNKTLGEEALSIKKLMRGEQVESTAKPSAPQRPPLLLPKPVVSIKEPQKLPTSPPLPPSLFKTMPLTFSTHATSSLKTTLSVSKANEASRLNSSKPQIITASSVLPSAKSQTFAVPSPPRSKYLSAPSSIASSANKQAASLLQLKRSASLDDSGSLLSKQQRLEQDRLMRKSMYGPAVGNNSPASTAKLLQQQFPSKEEALASYYPPLMTSFVVPQQRAIPAPANPSPALNITKLNDAILKSTGLLPPTGIPPMPRTPTLPALTQAQLNLLAASTTYQQLPGITKSPLDMMRLPGAAASVDSPLLPPPLSPPKNNRLMGPPVSVGNKIKRPAPLSPSTIAAVKMSPFLIAPSSSSATTSAAQKPATSQSNNTAHKKVTFRSSPPALINFRSALPIKPAAVKSAMSSPPVDPLRLSPNSNDTKKSNGVALANQMSKAPIKSLREFRPISKDNSVDILDLSGGKSTQKEFQSPKSNASSTVTASNSLEAALNKVKQSISACTVTTVDKSSNSATCTTTTARADDLQNLHMLSESATAREKIALKSLQPTISTTTTLTSSLGSSFYEKPKQQAATLVRQQNASVRNIPNPSALAFRNQQPLTTVAATTTASSTTTSPTSSAVVDADAKPSAKADASKSSNTSPNTSAATTPPHRPAKKLTTIDQVAATLNIRAAAAEASAARAASAAAAATTQDDSATVAKNETPAKTMAESTAAAAASNATAKSTSSVAKTELGTPAVSTAVANTTAVATNSTPEATANATATDGNSTKPVVKSVTPSPSLSPAASKTTTETPSTKTSGKQPSAALNNNNNTSSSDNNNKSSANNNNNNKSSKSTNSTPASTSAPLSAPLSLSSSSLSSASESNQTGLVVQGSV